MKKTAPTKFDLSTLAGMIDLSAVRANSDEAEIRKLATAAGKHQCIAVFTLPTYTPLIKKLLSPHPFVKIGGVVGFPGGATTTRIKVAEALELIDQGCSELDMVINIARLLSCDTQYVQNDVRAVVEASAGIPVKVILECHYLDEDQIRTACELCIEAGASYVKTGTGWTTTGATMANVSLIKRCVGDQIGIKAAGGIHTLETLTQLYLAGATRFGISLNAGEKIFREHAMAQQETKVITGPIE